jgi:anti-sigma regulatory factor (Ser/Thr protein kinase)
MNIALFAAMQELEMEDRYETTLNAEMSLVPIVLRRVAAFAVRLEARRIDELLIVVRELLENAIIHGSGSDASRMVRLFVRFVDGRFEVEVDDEGEGFDYESLDLRLPDDPFSLSRRGLIIAHELSEELSFVGRGNRARAFVHACEDPDRGERDLGVAAAVDQKYGEEPCTNQMART